LYLCGECGNKFEKPRIITGPKASALTCGKECPRCGGSPWNYTRIDEPTSLKVSESYIVGIDITGGVDVPTLTVTRQNGSKLEIVNVIRGKQEEALYELLTTKL
jgi:DNA-directed RNA polymerase subunit RPC12/RpoP